MITIDVYPEDDLYPHTMGKDCPCQPTIKEAEGGIIIVHNSWDGREEIEYQKELKGKVIL